MILDRIEDIWRNPIELHRALHAQAIPLSSATCIDLSYLRGRLASTPRAEDGDYRTFIRGLIADIDRVVHRAAALDIDNPPITAPGEPA